MRTSLLSLKAKKLTYGGDVLLDLRGMLYA